MSAGVLVGCGQLLGTDSYTFEAIPEGGASAGGNAGTSRGGSTPALGGGASRESGGRSVSEENPAAGVGGDVAQGGSSAAAFGAATSSSDGGIGPSGAAGNGGAITTGGAAADDGGAIATGGAAAGDGGAIATGGAVVGEGGAAPASGGGSVLSCAAICSSCEEKPCFTTPWKNVPYTVQSAGPNAAFDWMDLDRIQTAISAWSEGISFIFCGESCSRYERWLRIEPGTIAEVGVPITSGAQRLTLTPGDALYRYAHDLGHALGLVDDIQRPDRDLDPSIELSCATNTEAPHLWRCAGTPTLDPAAPQVSTSALGGYPGPSESIMVAEAHANCADSTGWAGPELPTAADISNISELAVSYYWSPFTPLTAQFPEPSPGSSRVPFIGGAAVCSLGYPDLKLFVRGTDSRVYWSEKRLNAGVFLGWSDFLATGSREFASDPACTVDDAGELSLAVTDVEGSIWFRTLSGSDWVDLGRPAPGGASAPALTSHIDQEAGETLDVFARGLDGRLYQKRRQQGAWSEWVARGLGLTFAGKPSATRYKDSEVLVAMRGLDTSLNVLELDRGSEVLHVLPANLKGDPAIVTPDPAIPYVFLQGLDNRLWQWEGLGETGSLYILGGRLSGSPGASTRGFRTDVVATIATPDGPALWWKFSQFSPYRPTCQSAAGACALCDD